MSNGCVKKDKLGRNILFYACSGAANVAEIADMAARQLRDEGYGEMNCLVGVAAGHDDHIQAARNADLNVLIEGCDMNCARRIFDERKLPNYVQVRITRETGLEKDTHSRADSEQVKVVIEKIKNRLPNA